MHLERKNYNLMSTPEKHRAMNANKMLKFIIKTLYLSPRGEVVKLILY